MAPVVLMNDGEYQVGCRWYVLLPLLIDLCVEERRLRGAINAEHHVHVVITHRRIRTIPYDISKT